MLFNVLACGYCMRIKGFAIEGLYGKYNLQWALREDVNIITGDNGSYKTTLLKILSSICEPELISDAFAVKDVTVSLTDGTTVEYRNYKDSLHRFQKEAEGSVETGVKADLVCEGVTNLSQHSFYERILSIKKGKENVSVQDYRRQRKSNFVSTFDVSSGGFACSVLDRQLERLECAYAYYLADLTKLIMDCIQQHGRATRDDLSRINAHNEAFVQIVNRAFDRTNKSVDMSQSRLRFKVGDDLLEDNKCLSAGEKQFLIVMLTVLLQRKEKYVLIMDQPELGMHLDWQRKLLTDILTLNPNCQLIIATHSPALIMDGWESFIVPVSSLFSERI